MDVWPDSVLGSAMLRTGRARQVAERALTGLVSRTYDEASLIAVTSPGQLDLLRSRGVPGAKLRYAPVWADEDIFYPRPATRDLLPEGARDASLVVMYAGSMGHVQNLRAAVEAVAAVRDVGVHLVLVGGGIAEQDLRARAAGLRAENVHFLGSVPQAAMGPLSAAADLHLVSLADTPLLRVTMPSKVQASLMAGRPVLAHVAGDAAELIEANDAGLAAAPGDPTATVAAVTRLTGMPDEQLAQMGAAARRCFEQTFSEEVGSRRLETMLVNAQENGTQ
jgi:glycosyltransferase involved in cell wall biosynthesis